ncbi:MAG: carbohydrate binding family 9 domain-containing protein [Flavobacteriales bacterium]|nr:carbohydrate binding family 9 domain-containing protein [Flavobacteriales bacterium]
MKSPWFIVVIFLLFRSSLFPQADFGKRTLFIRKATSPIIIDGLGDDAAWAYCTPADQFIQQFPFDTSLAKSQTIVKMTYDDKAIYILAECFNAKPGKYVVESMKRDFNIKRNDCFNVYLDPFDDKLNGFVFGVNAYGAQREGLIENGGNFDPNLRWDNKWFSAVKRTPEKWIVEMKIPFKTIRYKYGINNWGINFTRSDQAINEISAWNKIPFNFNNASLAFTGTLAWDIPPRKAGVNISLIPYAIGGVNHDYIKDETRWLYNSGGDAKIAVTSSLNLDITGNPDFSQVDVDQQVTNLTRFSLFFPEQRQFFLENSDLFARFGFSRIRPFFSRRIGLRNGEQVPIIAGVRLSGKLSRKIRIGAMNIQTAGSSKLNVEAQNYSVGALQWQAFGRSNFGLIFVNRQGFEGWRISSTDYNRVVGIDYDLQSKDNKWQGKFFFHHSISPEKNFNAFAHASFLMYRDSRWTIMWNHEYVGKNYNAETGFVPRQFFYNGQTNQTIRLSYWRLEPMIEYSFYPKSKKLYRITPGIYNSYYADSVFAPTDVITSLYVNMDFYNTMYFSIGYNELYTNLLFPIDPSGTGSKVLPTGGYHYREAVFSFRSDARRRFTLNASGAFGSFFHGVKLTYGLTMNFRIQPWGNIGLTFSRDEILNPEPFDNIHLMLISPRIELTFRNNIFWTTFVQYNEQINNLNINSRFQWRFLPMSDLFIVYTDNFNTLDFSSKNRGVIIKFVYWLTI